MTERERGILTVLANDVRTLSDRQIARTWWTDSAIGIHRCRQKLKQLCESGWLKSGTVLARASAIGSKPLYCWNPGDAKPDFVAYARILRQRSQNPAKLVKIFAATEQTNNLLGTGKRPTVRLAQLTHELQVSEVYLKYRPVSLEGAKWIGEENLPLDWRLKIRPDALLVDNNGNFIRAIEYGGNYLPERLEDLHQSLTSILLGYEVW